MCRAWGSKENRNQMYLTVFLTLWDFLNATTFIFREWCIFGGGTFGVFLFFFSLVLDSKVKIKIKFLVNLVSYTALTVQCTIFYVVTFYIFFVNNIILNFLINKNVLLFHFQRPRSTCWWVHRCGCSHNCCWRFESK